MAFHEWLAQELERRHWSVTQFARRVGVGHPTVSRWMSGQRRPDAASAGRIARALGVPPVVVLDLLGEHETPSTETDQLEQRLAQLRTERAGLNDEERQRGTRLQELGREIQELEIAQERLRPPMFFKPKFDEEPMTASGLPRRRYESPEVEDLESRIRDISRDIDGERSLPTSARDVALSGYRELRRLLNVLTDRLVVGNELNGALSRMSDEWSSEEKQAFAIGVRVGLEVGRATMWSPQNVADRSGDEGTSAGRGLESAEPETED